MGNTQNLCLDYANAISSLSQFFFENAFTPLIILWKRIRITSFPITHRTLQIVRLIFQFAIFHISELIDHAMIEIGFEHDRYSFAFVRNISKIWKRCLVYGGKKSSIAIDKRNECTGTSYSQFISMLSSDQSPINHKWNTHCYWSLA